MNEIESEKKKCVRRNDDFLRAVEFWLKEVLSAAYVIFEDGIW